MSQLRAHLRRGYIEIAVPVPVLRLEVGGRWLITVEPDAWHWERHAYPPSWRELPPVDGIVAPIMYTWSLGIVHVHHFRWPQPGERDGS